MQYTGYKKYDCFVDVKYTIDGMVCIEENIRYDRYLPRHIYEIEQAIMYMMTKEQVIKVIKYMERITDNKFSFNTRILDNFDE